jgi:transcriptional regulator with XRE-family HTH domain
MENETGSGDRAINTDWPTALAVLRVIRGWSQEHLAKACGLRGGTISDYERGKLVPGLAAAQRLLAAQGYTLGDLDEATYFIQRIRVKRLGGSSSTNASPVVRRREVEDVAVAAGTVLTQIVRLVLTNSDQPAELPTGTAEFTPGG